MARPVPSPTVEDLSLPLVVVSTLPARVTGIASFAEDALRYIEREVPGRRIVVVCHEGETAVDERFERWPIIDVRNERWPDVVADRLAELNPYCVHIQHEYSLYARLGEDDQSRLTGGLLRLLARSQDWPVLLEMHTVHSRLHRAEEDLIARVAEQCQILAFKCDYQKWRLEYVFTQEGRPVPSNIAVIPHGARPDISFGAAEIDAIKRELGLSDLVGRRLVGLVGWMQNSKRWDLVTQVWPEVQEAIRNECGEEWLLLAAGDVRDASHLDNHELFLSEISKLEQHGLARYFQFSPQGEMYYKALAVCDFVILPVLDETQSGTLSRIIALNKPYIATAPLEEFTAMTVESEGGLLFTNRETLKRGIMRLATQEALRWQLGERLKIFLANRVSWERVARQYAKCYQLCRYSKTSNTPIRFPHEFEGQVKWDQFTAAHA